MEEEQKQKKLEDSFWADFIRGKSLEKYEVETITTWHIDQFKAAELMMGTY